VKLSPVTTGTTKVCLRCDRERPLVMFPPIGKLRDMRNPVCQACLDTKESERRWSYKNPEMAQKLAPIMRRAKTMWASARLRAWRNRVPFKISAGWIAKKLEHGKCEVTGIEFDKMWTGRGRTNLSPSIDRIVPEKGYTPSNCRVVVWIYNAAKGPGKHEEVMQMARALIKAEAAARAAAGEAKVEKAA
jgi:hypothetical protein